MANDEHGAPVLPPPGGSKDYTSHHKPPVPFNQKYQFIKGLGTGGEANCDRYETNDPYQAVAVKTIVRPNPQTDYLHEANILVKLPRHSSIPEIIEIFHNGHLRIVMPLYGGGNLSSLLHRLAIFGCKMPEAFVWHAFVQIAQGLHHLHNNTVLPVLHRDLKPENLLVDLTPVGVLFDNIKIIDFGMATDQMNPHEHVGGTPEYQPPECPTASTAADIYAVGACIHYLMTGKAPKPECPKDIQDNDRHVWYAKAAPLVQRIVHNDHTDYSSNKQPLSYADASKATFNHTTPLPTKGYSPLLEHWMLRTLDRNASTRATTAELVTNMAYDARSQIDFYTKWIPVSGKRPKCGFAYPEPPAGWKPK